MRSLLASVRDALFVLFKDSTRKEKKAKIVRWKVNKNNLRFPKSFSECVSYLRS